MGVTNHAYDVLTPGSVINESVEWVSEIYSIDEQNYVHGGEHGYANVPHEQLANRTMYLKATLEDLITRLTLLSGHVDDVQTALLAEIAATNATCVDLRNDLDKMGIDMNEADAALAARIDTLTLHVAELEEQLNTHVHDYAGSDEPGGDALHVRTLASDDRAFLTGVTAAAPNELHRSTRIQMVGGTLEASEFAGDLRGNATTATRLKAPFSFTVTGDMAGVTVLDGGSDVSIGITLNRQTAVHAGWYGPTEDTTLDTASTFVVPAVHVNSAGVVTGITDRVVTVPNFTRSRTTGALPATGRLLIVGAPQAEDIAETKTSDGAYMIDGRLYSCNEQVVTVYQRQDIVNKTYNGFNLGSACERGVDATPGGTLGSPALITSDAVAQAFTSMIANGLRLDGPSDGKLLVGNDDATAVGKSSVLVNGDTLTAGNVHVLNELEIPGGKLWIDDAVVSASADAASAVDEALETLRQRISRLEAEVEQLRGEGS